MEGSRNPVLQATRPLYEIFDFFEIGPTVVDEELERMTSRSV